MNSVKQGIPNRPPALPIRLSGRLDGDQAFNSISNSVKLAS